jgi:hypothetical protein
VSGMVRPPFHRVRQWSCDKAGEYSVADHRTHYTTTFPVGQIGARINLAWLWNSKDPWYNPGGRHMDCIQWQKQCERLLDLLAAYPAPDGVFNQYHDVHPELDLPNGAEIRRRNLRCYLQVFAGARCLLLGEAAGYAGCRFSGIPFTCEVQLVGPQPLSWAAGHDLALEHHRGLAPEGHRGLARSSRAEALWVERSAMIVWGALGKRRDCLLWNAFPWHPFGVRGPLSNRHPGLALGDGLEVLCDLLALFPAAKPYAVGRVAQRALAAMDMHAPYIRHPSHGGKQKFIAGVAAVRSTPIYSQAKEIEDG